MFKINGWSKNYSEKVYIYEEAAAQFSETLLFMALHEGVSRVLCKSIQ